MRSNFSVSERAAVICFGFASLAAAGNEPGGAGLREDELEMARFFERDPAAGFGDAVVAAALVIAIGIGTLAKFLNEAGFEQTLDGAIERAGAELNFARRALGDFLHDGVAVAFAFSKRDENVEAIGV